MMMMIIKKPRKKELGRELETSRQLGRKTIQKISGVHTLYWNTNGA